MKTIPARPLEPNEAAIVRSALLRAAVRPVLSQMLEEVESLNVIGVCDCGCPSVYFREIGSGDYILADAVGYARGEERIDIAIWASSHGQLAALEVVNHGRGYPLPPAESVCSWEQAGVRELKR
jgi:hypothetical protein